MFFHWSQNNIVGVWIQNDDVDKNVVIEADSEEKANEFASSIMSFSDHCDCCGNRWYSGHEIDPEDIPSDDCWVYLADGSKLSGKEFQQSRDDVDEDDWHEQRVAQEYKEMFE